jgi:hypothetical protein
MKDNQGLFVWVSIASAVFFVGSILAVGIVIVRLPPDYFQQESRSRRERRTPVWVRVGKNVLGWLLILAGIAMLVLPGQGMLVILIGVMLADFPGKYRLERWIVSRGKVLKVINKLRRRFKRPPLEMQAATPALA